MRLSGLMRLKCLEILQNNLGGFNETEGGGFKPKIKC